MSPEQTLELTNKTRPRAAPQAFQIEGGASAKVQWPDQMGCVQEQTGNLCAGTSKYGRMEGGKMEEIGRDK